MSFRRSPSLTASELFLFTFLQLAIFSTITTGQEPTICKYLITKQYECEVPRACTNVMRPPCKETVHGTWSDQDDIVHYHDVCIFTDHFTTCTFQPDFTYRCQMVWEQRRHPSGNYLGDARSGFRRVTSSSVDPKNSRPVSKSQGKTVKSSRRKRAGGGTC